jgi:hypothetical protein
MASKTPIVSQEEDEETPTGGSPPVYNDATGKLDLSVNGLSAESKIGGQYPFGQIYREMELIGG